VRERTFSANLYGALILRGIAAEGTLQRSCGRQFSNFRSASGPVKTETLYFSLFKAATYSLQSHDAIFLRTTIRRKPYSHTVLKPRQKILNIIVDDGWKQHNPIPTD